MSYNTLSYISTTDNKDEFIKLENDFKLLLPIPLIKEIINPFKGIVAQYDLRELDKEELLERISENIATISKKYPEKKIASIEVDCYGGKCTSEGQVFLNGNVINNEPNDHLAHMKLLKLLSENYKTWHFEPFTREYFTKKGGIWGQINGEQIMLFGISIYTSYKNKPDYRCDMTPNELILEKKGKFYLYFMEPLDNCIKILGSVLDDSEEELNELKTIINEEVSYTNSYVFIELFNKDEVINMENLEGEERTEMLYRFKAFNERPVAFNENTNMQADNDIETKSREIENQKSFWSKFKNIFNGR